MRREEEVCQELTRTRPKRGRLYRKANIRERNTHNNAAEYREPDNFADDHTESIRQPEERKITKEEPPTKHKSRQRRVDEKSSAGIRYEHHIDTSTALGQSEEASYRR